MWLQGARPRCGCMSHGWRIGPLRGQRAQAWRRRQANLGCGWLEKVISIGAVTAEPPTRQGRGSKRDNSMPEELSAQALHDCDAPDLGGARGSECMPCTMIGDR